MMLFYMMAASGASLSSASQLHRVRGARGVLNAHTVGNESYDANASPWKSGCDCEYHDLVADVSRWRCRGMCCDGETNTCEKDGSASMNSNSSNFYQCICHWVAPTPSPTAPPTPVPTPAPTATPEPTRAINTLRCHPMENRIVIDGIDTREDCINECVTKEHCAAANFYWQEKSCYLCPNGFQLRGSGLSDVWIKDARSPEPPSEDNMNENSTLETLHDHATIRRDFGEDVAKYGYQVFGNMSQADYDAAKEALANRGAFRKLEQIKISAAVTNPALNDTLSQSNYSTNASNLSQTSYSANASNRTQTNTLKDALKNMVSL